MASRLVNATGAAQRVNPREARPRSAEWGSRGSRRRQRGVQRLLAPAKIAGGGKRSQVRRARYHIDKRLMGLPPRAP